MPLARLLSIGPLVNLQDARASAAWGADYVSFSLERGSLHKINERTLLSIIEWLAGPLPVISMGEDAEPLGELMARDWGGAVWFELSAAVHREVPTFTPADRLLWTLTPDLVHRMPDGLAERLRGAHAVVLHAPTTVGPALLPLVRQLKLALDTTPLLIRADGLSTQVIEVLFDPALTPDAPLADGIAAAPTLAKDFTQLDYDAIEALIERYR